MASLIQRVEKLEHLVISLQKQIDELKAQKMATSSTINFAETRESMGDDFNNVNFKLNQFGHDLEQMKNEFAKWLKEMQDSLNQKADIEAL